MHPVYPDFPLFLLDLQEREFVGKPDPWTAPPDKWLPLIDRSQTPLPFSTHQPPEVTAASPLRAERLLVDYLAVSSDPEPAQRATFLRWLKAHADKRSRRPFGDYLYRSWARCGRLIFLYDPRFPDRMDWLRVRVDLQTDEGRSHSRRALVDLGRFMALFRTRLRWRVAQVDIAVDYAAWVWDLLMVRPRVAATHFLEGEPHDGTMRSGSRSGSHFKQYHRGFKGDAPRYQCTRIERVERRPEIEGKRIGFRQLPQMRDPFGGLSIRPVWGDLDHRQALDLRLLQLGGFKQTLFEWLGRFRGLTPTGRKKAWVRIHRDLARDPEALRLIQQPSAVFNDSWRDEACRVVEAINDGIARGGQVPTLRRVPPPPPPPPPKASERGPSQGASLPGDGGPENGQSTADVTPPQRCTRTRWARPPSSPTNEGFCGVCGSPRCATNRPPMRACRPVSHAHLARGSPALTSATYGLREPSDARRGTQREVWA